MSQQKQKFQESNPSARWRLEGHQRSAIASFFGELVATGVFVFVACMGCVETPVFQNSHFRSGLTFGLAILIAIQCFGSVSGAHLNPAITLAAWLYGVIGWMKAIAYFVAQAAGALIGYGLLVAVLPESSIKGVDNPAGVCVTVLAPEISVLQGVFIEFLITCCLVMVACSVWDPRNVKFQDSVAVRFGLTVSCLILTAGLFTGASMNPTRSLGPAVWNNSWAHHWIYWVGPLVAGAVTSLIYKMAFKGDEVIELRSSDAKIRMIGEIVVQ
ncbi:aquaporin AQPcic [Drosophila eugracilis]|uniref:aquaporin AQPcic n=1 Tax=Drosophila eugracilis TaxID=29029 RepID=UPI0007E7FF5E|nr:aquaporin AQPcic [Drosophila eugracilis]